MACHQGIIWNNWHSFQWNIHLIEKTPVTLKSKYNQFSFNVSKMFAIAPDTKCLKVIHKENSRFLNRVFPFPCLYHELNMIIHTR